MDRQLWFSSAHLTDTIMFLLPGCNTFNDTSGQFHCNQCDVDRCWKIEVPYGRVKLSFTGYFDLGYCTNPQWGCTIVEMRDGLDEGAKLLDMSYGYIRLDHAVQSSGRHMYIKLTLGDLPGRVVFYATYEAANISEGKLKT